ncbi:MAG: flippase-like domain-containing protein [Anaerolineales bacterium]|nr:flippase-like domain-containing protein [Anaerolineales bacterium]
MRRSWQWLLGLLISVLALAWALRDVRLVDVGDVLRGANYVWAAPALGLILAGQVARALSWRVLLGRQLSFRRVFGALNAGYLLNNVLPFRLGEVGRAYLISRSRQLTTAQALSSVLVERVIDLCMIVGMLAVFGPLAAGLMGGALAVAAVFSIPILALTGLYIVARKPAWLLALVRWGVGLLARLWGQAQRLEDLFHSMVDGLAALQDGRRLVMAAAFSALAWGCAGLSAWLLLVMFLPQAPPTMGFFMLVVTGLSIAVPSAPGSLGVWQAAGMGALGVFGVTGSLAFSIAVVHHFANYGLTSLMGALALAQEGETLAHLARSARALLTAAPASDEGRPTTET